MAWHPDAIQKNIPPGTNDPKIIPIGMIFHVRAGLGDSLYNYFNGPSGGVESHFYIRFDGTLEQYRDSVYEADANLDANSFIRDGVRYGFLSVETEGLEFGEWTLEQMATLRSLAEWGMRIHHIPRRVCPGPSDGGFGYHVMFGAPGPWTPVAKSCPGPERVKQFKEIFVPWLLTATPIGEDWFDVATKQELKDALSEVLIAHAQSGTALQAMVRQQAANGVDQALGGTNVPAKLQKIIWVDTKVKRGTNPDGTPALVSTLQELADAKTYANQAAGVDIDEAEIAASVGALLLPVVRTAVVDTLAEADGVDEQAVAESVAALFADRLGLAG